MNSNNSSFDHGDEGPEPSYGPLHTLKQYRQSLFLSQTGLLGSLRRKLQTWNSGLPKHELLAHLFRLFKRDLALRLGKLYPHALVPLDVREGPAIVAHIQGGMGDVVLACRFLCRLSETHAIDFAVEHHNPGLVTLFLKNHPRFIGASAAQYNINEPLCAARLRIANLVSVEHIGQSAPETLRRDLAAADMFLMPYRQYISASPFLDGILSDRLTAAGMHRHDSCFVQFGLDYGLEDFLRPEPTTLTEILDRYGLISNEYVTIADGWDAGFGFLDGRRPTKALKPDFNLLVVEQLHAFFPDLILVQLGDTRTGDDIPSIDVNLRGKTSLSDTLMLLAGARLHIDIEGGLVHLAKAAGTTSMVFFGPTNPAFFGYPDNFNRIADYPCVNCYWSTNTWMAICPLRKNKICMDYHDPVAAAKCASTFLLAHS